MRQGGDPTAAALAERYKVVMPNLLVSDHDVSLLIDYLSAVALP
jgi:hypothetical protein